MYTIPIHTNRDSFFFQSDLTDEQKDAIIKWQKEMTPKEMEMLYQIIEDVESDRNYDDQ